MKKQFDLRAWHKRNRHSYGTAAEALGMGKTAYGNYLKKTELPKWLILACKALDRGIKA